MDEKKYIYGDKLTASAINFYDGNWEMMHSLFIKKGGEKLRTFLKEHDIDIENEHIDQNEELSARMSEFLKETGCDASGKFAASCGDRTVKAFASWQYFCRLHHHAWKKLQARGEHAPSDSATGQPSRCGTLTDQRMGEIENWALLSHGAETVLSDIRRSHSGDFGKTRELFRKVLRSLGIILDEDSSGLTFRIRNDDDAGLERKISECRCRGQGILRHDEPQEQERES